MIHHRGLGDPYAEDAEVTEGNNEADATVKRVAPELVTWQLALMP